MIYKISFDTQSQTDIRDMVYTVFENKFLNYVLCSKLFKKYIFWFLFW